MSEGMRMGICQGSSSMTGDQTSKAGRLSHRLTGYRTPPTTDPARPSVRLPGPINHSASAEW